MNTPEKSQIGGSLSKFEDSPVFNYLSNLSPIKPVKSAPVTQTFKSLNFSSLPSIFTSPHVSLQKESRFLRRHNTPSNSQSEFAYIDTSSNKENEVFVGINQLQTHLSDLHREPGEPDSLGEALPEPFNAESDPQIEPYQDLKYNCDSPNSDTKAGISANGNASYPEEVLGSSAITDHGTSISRTSVHKSPSGWESLLSDGADLLMFDSPNIAQDLNALFKSPQMVRVGSSPESHFQQDNPGFLESDSTFLVDVSEFQTKVHVETELGDYTHNGYPTMVKSLTSHPNENADDEPMASLNRGLWRRCLVFDANAARRKNLRGASSSNASMSMESDQNLASTIRKPVTSKTVSSSSLRVLSGIGLHLNTLASSADNVVHVCAASSSTSFQSPTITSESLCAIFTGTSFEKNAESGPAQGSDDAILATGLVSVDDFDQNSPRKKRQKSESSGDESCKRCNCKKSKCLKLYCECFAYGVYCIGTCACQDCYNKPIHEETVLATRKQIESRNPLAFAPKVIRTSDPLPDVKDEIMNTPASARHKRGCNCKKSSCQKKYCECYQGGVGCSLNCRCETCKNVFGTKDGSVPVASPHDEEEEIEKVEKKKMNKKSSRNIMLQNNEEHNHNNTFPATPLRLTRMSMQQPFSSKGKPPRSSFLTVGSASGLNASQKFGKPNHLNPPPKFQRNISAVEDEIEIPEILRSSNGSPNSIVKTSSPNSKRISSPHSNFGSSSGRRSTRKLVLQSIPSFPSLTQP